MRKLVALLMMIPIAVTAGSQAQTTKPGARAASRPTSMPASVPAGLTHIPRTRLALLCPEGYEVAAYWSGLYKEKAGVSVTTMEIPGAARKAAKQFSDPALKTRGMHLRSREDVRVSGYAGTLLYFHQTANESEIAKWILVFGDEENCVMVTGYCRRADEAANKEELKKILLSVHWDKNRQVNPLEGLPFRVEVPAILKPSQWVNDSLILSRSGETPPASPTEPMVIITARLGAIEFPDKKKLAVAKLLSLPGFSDFNVENVVAITIAGMSGYEVTASAVHTRTKEKMALYEVILFGPGAYYIFNARVGAKERQKVLPQFREMALSLAPVEKGAAKTPR
ncbi:MAG TPA: hypothetical protein VMZ50_14485 [Phycisphaerae bacterium]|nr:hypothetical protein [Phycisphaerae bacterium]